MMNGYGQHDWNSMNWGIGWNSIFIVVILIVLVVLVLWLIKNKKNKL